MRRVSFAAKQSYQINHPYITSKLVAPPGGWLIKAGRGWLHHRIRWGFRRDHTTWETECGQLLSSGRSQAVLVPLSDVDFVCGRCELVATEVGLAPTTLIPEGVCEARRNRMWDIVERETP